MRRDQLDTLGDLEARSRGVDDERGHTLGRRRLAGAREHDVEVGDAAVRDPGLGAVQDEAGAIRLRRGGDRRDVGAGFALGQRERRDLAAVGDRRQPGTALVLGPEQTDRAAAEPLHGKREIGEAGKARQDLAHEAERAHVQAVVHAAAGGRHRMAQKPGLGEMRDEHPAGGVDIGRALVEIGQSAGGKALDLIGQRAVALVEERPGEEAAIGHGRRRVQLPSNSGALLREKRAVCAPEVLGLHADRLSLGFGLDRCVEAHVPLLVEHRLGHHVGEGRPRGEPCRELQRLIQQLLAWAEPVVEAPAQALFGIHRAARAAAARRRDPGR